MMDIIKLDRDDHYWKRDERYFMLGTNKVRYMFDKIRNAFKSEYIPHEEISVDESMVPFKGRLSFKQYIYNNFVNVNTIKS